MGEQGHLAEQYLRDGVISRARIALDIKRRRLRDPDEIRRLCEDPRVQAVFIGSAYSGKEPAREWTASYLDALIGVVGAESFNVDYLLYLNAVSERVAADGSARHSARGSVWYRGRKGRAS